MEIFGKVYEWKYDFSYSLGAAANPNTGVGGEGVTRNLLVSTFVYPEGIKDLEDDRNNKQLSDTWSKKGRAKLIFLKTTMIENVNFEVKGYKAANPDFPDQTTADQFFSEEQFEAYRKLGK